MANNWRTGNPDKNGSYIVTRESSWSGKAVIETASFAKDLHKVDDYDFMNNHNPGWYKYDSEYGYYEILGVTAWQPFPEPYKKEDTDD